MSVLTGSESRRDKDSTIHARVEGVLAWLSIYAVPAAVVVVSVIALVAWPSMYPAVPGVPLNFRAVVDLPGSMQMSDARIALGAVEPVAKLSTSRVTAPVWFLFWPNSLSSIPEVIEIPSRHLTDLECWDSAAGRSLGVAERLAVIPTVTGRFIADKTGYAFRWDPSIGKVLCRAQFAGPARLSVLAWSSKAYQVSAHQHHRQQGLLEGGMVVLATFVLIMSIVNRQELYLLFSVWLVFCLRTAELTAGYDVYWLGQVVPGNLLLPARALTMSLFAFVTCMIFIRMFKRELAATMTARIHRSVMWLSAPILLSAVILPYGRFLPLLWGMVSIYGLLMVHGLWKVRVWHARAGRIVVVAFAVVLLSNVTEVFAAVFELESLAKLVNSVTGAMAASLLASFAIAEQMRVETTARVEAQARLELAFQAMPAGMFTSDDKGVLTAWNPTLERMFDLGSRATVSWLHLFGQQGWTALEAAAALGQSEIQLLHVDGIRWFSVRATSANACIEGSVEEVTERVAAIDQLRYLADHDPLTASLNRHGVESAFNEASGRQVEGSPLSLVYLNLNSFKRINDVFGHEAGDEVLIQAALRTRRMLAPGHSMGRVGGDEFVIVMPDTPVSLAELVARSIGEVVRRETYLVAGGYVTASASIGVVEVTPGCTFEDATALASNACQQAGKSDSQDVVIYQRYSPASRKVQMDLDLMTRLNNADLSEVLCVQFRRVVAIGVPPAGSMVIAELALKGSVGNGISAADIMTAARKTGNAGAVDRWQLSTILPMIERLQVLNTASLVLLELSGAALSDTHFAIDAFPLLLAHPVAARKLCFEIGEAAAFSDIARISAFAELVAAVGPSVSLADYGSGHTVLEGISALPVRLARLSDAAVEKAVEHPTGMSILEALVTMARRLEVRTIASIQCDFPGAEAVLMDMGIDYLVAEDLCVEPQAGGQISPNGSAGASVLEVV
jgi:diguanylate cyclase (GGDEF)-like protein